MQHIGRYQILRRLGKGGMGAVYKGLAPVVDKVVAIKLLAPTELLEDILGEETLRDIFMFEARTMASFHQPFLVTVYDYDHDDQGRPFFVMEYICNNLGDMLGETYRIEQASRVIQAAKVLYYGQQLLRALDFLHHNGVVHRDIKPQNILITDEDRIKICDFGMALVDGISFSGPSTMQVGSPCYTPPEQRKDPNGVDGRADLYSAAVVLYRMLTGQLPGMQSLSLSLVNPLYDQQWDAFFQKALQWNPDERFQSAAAMLDAFVQLQLGEGGAASFCCLSGQMPSDVLRTESVNVCASRAAQVFAINTLHRPLRPICNDFVLQNEIVQDRATGLLWQRQSSRYPLSYADAHAYVAALNQKKDQGVACWRLPTVNELLSLLSQAAATALQDSPMQPAKWLWSCDRHGQHESWYVNMDMGFTGVQDVTCLNHVRAVASICS